MILIKVLLIRLVDNNRSAIQVLAAISEKMAIFFIES